MKKAIILTAIVLLIGLGTFFFVLPTLVESHLNPVLYSSLVTPSDKARDLHPQLLIADLHADSLLWSKDLALRNSSGHVDVPRLVEGNVALQAFTIVTKVPRGLNIESNSDQTDTITLLAVAARWPISTWGSLKERALYQARKLSLVAARSNGRFVIIKTTADLSKYLQRRSSEPDITAGLLGVEGAHALEGDLDNIDIFFDHGTRMMSPAHFFDNEMGGSAHGLKKGGLTEKGREMVGRMQAHHMIVDLAHASSDVIDDVLAISTKPMVVSHTGVRGTCDNTRNLSDKQIKGVAKTGGVIGIGYWETAVCGTSAKAIAQTIRYVANLVGAAHISLGSDYDGAVAVSFDTTGVVHITDALLSEGFSEEEVRMIMGGNAIRVLLQSLP